MGKKYNYQPRKASFNNSLKKALDVMKELQVARYSLSHVTDPKLKEFLGYKIFDVKKGDHTVLKNGVYKDVRTVPINSVNSLIHILNDDKERDVIKSTLQRSSLFKSNQNEVDDFIRHAYNDD